MSNQLQTIQQAEIDNWDYNESVKTFAGKIQEHRSLSLEIVRELFIAHAYFAKMGDEISKRNLKGGTPPIVPNGTIGKTMSEKGEISFSSYLEEIGIARRTAYNWLKRYIPGEDRLLEVEEAKAIERKQKEEHYQHIMNLVNHYVRTGKRPKEWDEECQRLYDQLHQRRTMLDPVEELERQQKDFTHVFASKMQRASLYWDRRELKAWSTIEAEPVRSLAQQVQFNHQTRSVAAHQLAELEQVVAKYPDATLAEVRIQIQNLYHLLTQADE